MPETFCPLPWISLSLRNDGQYRVCCPANQSEGKGLLTADDGRALRADSDFYAEVRNAPLMRSVRRAMNRGEWHSSCKRCFDEEKSGVKSRRLIEKEIWKERITAEQAYPLTHADGTLNGVPVQHMDLRFGNRCNLKCRSCNPTESAKWLGDHFEIWGPSYNESTYKVTIEKGADGEFSVTPNPYDWHDSPFFWRELETHLPAVKLIYFAGGEPLLIDRHFEFLEKCVSSGRAGEITIEYNTNLTLLPKNALELWRKFKKVHFGVSVDGVGRVNDYIRHPSKWENVERNLRILDQAPGNFVVWLAPTVMAYNILHLPDLLIWKMRQKFERVNSSLEYPLVSAHPLHGPPFLNVQMFLSEEKARIENRLREELPRVLSEVRLTYRREPKMLAAAEAQAREILEGYIRFMWAADLSQYREKFAHYTRALDRLRGQSLEEALPELHSIF
jgi:hypothetical protein